GAGVVEEPGRAALERDGRAAGDHPVATLRRLARLLDRGLDALRDEGERRPALALERRTRMVRDDEDGQVKRRVLAPPAVPRFGRPPPPAPRRHILAPHPPAPGRPPPPWRPRALR